MNPKYHLLAAVAALSLGACSTDDTCTKPAPENGEYKLSFTVAEDSETRMTLDAKDILRWEPTDQIGIYTVGQNVNSNTLTTADVNQSPVEFSGVLEHSVSSGDLFYAYYPYNATQSTDPKAVKLSIPAEQKQTTAGIYDGQSHPLVAVPMEFSQEWGSDACRVSSVRFRQLGAIVELQLYSSDEALCSESIRSVSFESETPLAGDFQFDLTTVTIDKEPTIAGYESTVATTLLEEPAAIPAADGEAARIYLTIAPGQYTGQIVVNTDAAKYTFRLAKTMAFERAMIKGLPADLAKAERDMFIHFEDAEVKRICVENWDTNSDGELSNKEAATVTDLKNVFERNNKITSFNELRYFTGLQSIGDYAFSGCSNLTSINIPKGVTTIGSTAFDGCSNLKSINLPDELTTIGNGAFQNCSSLTNITIPNGVTTIERGTFKGCSSLTTIQLPDGVTTFGAEAFKDCSSLTNINIPKGMTEIGDNVFQNCSSLTSITIPDKVTSIGVWAFYGCSSLTSIHLPDGLPTIESYAFADCSSLTNINIPEGVTAIGNMAFLNCSNMTSINIPKGVTTIGNSAFTGCSSLTNITIPEGVTAIADSAFQHCSNLTSINIPDGVTEIASKAFQHCSSLTNITIPQRVTSIGEYAFEYCSGLTSVDCKPTTPPTLGSDTFSKTSSSMKIYVPTASVEAYKTAVNWSKWATQIVAK